MNKITLKQEAEITVKAMIAKAKNEHQHFEHNYPVDVWKYILQCVQTYKEKN